MTVTDSMKAWKACDRQCLLDEPEIELLEYHSLLPISILAFITHK